MTAAKKSSAARRVNAPAVQLPLDGLPFDPVELSALGIVDRAQLYGECGLDAQQREVAEEAVRRLRRGEYGRKRGSA
jgi:hypothetical protein